MDGGGKGIGKQRGVRLAPWISGVHQHLYLASLLQPKNTIQGDVKRARNVQRLTTEVQTRKHCATIAELQFAAILVMTDAAIAQLFGQTEEVQRREGSCQTLFRF